jgi:cation:H+ antiporter
VGYLVWAYRNERATADEEAVMHESVAADAPAGPPSLPAACALALGGVAAVVLGAWLLVEGAIGLARGWGISETAIGLTVVAVGTSLPELVASAVAALRGHAAVALGNVIGSNIFNARGILGATAALTPLAIPPEILAFDIWVLLGATALLTLFVRTGWTVRRWEGAVFVGLYALYVGLII